MPALLVRKAYLSPLSHKCAFYIRLDIVTLKYDPAPRGREVGYILDRLFEHCKFYIYVQYSALFQEEICRS